MYKILSAFFLPFIVTVHLSAHITPAESSRLNYRIIGFSFPLVKGTVKYSIEISSGNYNNDDDFRKNIISTHSSKTNKIIAEVPRFGVQYTWRIVYANEGSAITKSKLYHFSTVMAPEVNSDSTRLQILIPAAKNKDMYVFVDADRTLYDMAGHPVWHLPVIEKRKTKVFTPHDLNRSYWGTITFIMHNHAYEINYNGDILWKEPDTGFNNKLAINGIKTLNYNEFTHLKNGHYMSLGVEPASWQVPGYVDNARLRYKKQITIDSNGTTQQKILFTRVTEFDQRHNIVWSWSSADYFKQSDLYSLHRRNGLFQIANTYESTFYFDEKKKVIYVSFHNIDRIIKLTYPGGDVLNTYGQLYEPGNLEIRNGLFCGQHGCRISQEGYIYLCNNNTCNRLCGQLPTILIMKEPTTPEGQLKKVWEYECTLDSMSEEEQSKLKFETGGSVFELPDRSIFSCMGGTYSKVFIVSRDKKILWSAIPEQWNVIEEKWKVMPGYKASIITRKELESLIWGVPVKH